MSDTTPINSDKARRVLAREALIFFRKLKTPTATWPGISHETMVDGLADALVELARSDRLGDTAYLQTLVHELQDRINSRLKG